MFGENFQQTLSAHSAKKKSQFPTFKFANEVEIIASVCYLLLENFLEKWWRGAQEFSYASLLDNIRFMQNLCNNVNYFRIISKLPSYH